MRVGVVVDNDFSFDVRVRKEADLLVQLGYEVYVLCFGYEGTQYEDIKGMVIERIPISKNRKKKLFFLYHLLPLYRNLWEKNVEGFVRKFKPEMLHVHDLIMSKPVHKGVKKEGMSIPIVLDLHENYPVAAMQDNAFKGILRSRLGMPHKWKKVELEYLKYASKIIVLSQKFADELRAEYTELSNIPFVVVPNVPDLEVFEQFTENEQPQLTTKGPVLLYFGVVAERRGIFETIKVVERLRDQGVDCTLLIIGPVDKADKIRFDRSITELQSSGHLIYIPWIPINELPAYMNCSDIALSPLHRNDQHESGVANKIYQYMYGRLPVVVSNCKPQKELIEGERAGLSYETQLEYEQALRLLIENHDKRKAMGQNGHEAVIAKYNITAFRDVFRKVFSTS